MAIRGRSFNADGAPVPSPTALPPTGRGQLVAAGCCGGGYCPPRILTRLEMAVLLLRLFGLPFP